MASAIDPSPAQDLGSGVVTNVTPQMVEERQREQERQARLKAKIKKFALLGLGGIAGLFLISKSQ